MESKMDKKEPIKSKIDELRDLEKLYTQSKQKSLKQNKYKEFDLSFKDFEQFNNLVSKQKIIDENKHFQRIEMGQQPQTRVDDDDESLEGLSEEPQSIYDNQPYNNEEDNDITQSQSLLKEFYKYEDNEEFYQPNYNDSYTQVQIYFEQMKILNKFLNEQNLKQQRVIYIMVVLLIIVLLLKNIIQFIQCLFEKERELSDVYLSTIQQFISLSLVMYYVHSLGIKLKDMLYKGIRYANAKFEKQFQTSKIVFIFELILQILVVILSSKTNIKAQVFYYSEYLSQVNMYLLRVSSLLIIAAIYLCLIRLTALQSYLMKQILNRQEEESGNKQDTSIEFNNSHQNIQI